MAQLGAKAMPTNRVAVPLDRAVRDALSTVPLADGDVTVTVCGPATALVDRGHLQQVLANVLGNAAKYGEPPVEIHVTGRTDAVELRVADSGRGVPPEFVPHLFDRFTRAKTGSATTRKGTGLGLFIVHQLVTANAGNIRYEPNRPSGASFVIRLEPARGGGY